MPEIPRFSWRMVVVSTIVALVAATAAGLVAAKVVHHDKGSTVSPVNPSQLNDNLTLTPDKKPLPLDKVTFTTFDGKKVTVASLRGKPLVINFFASYCAPCIKEMPALQQVHQEVGDKVQFLGLAVSDRTSEARKLVTRTKVTYQTALDSDADVITAVDSAVLPTTVLIDPTGKVVDLHPGEVTASELRSLLASKLGITT